jgi:hypothetical protein
MDQRRSLVNDSQHLLDNGKRHSAGNGDEGYLELVGSLLGEVPAV